MVQAEKEQNNSAKNPLLWVSIIVIGLIIFIFVASDRNGVTPKETQAKPMEKAVEPDISVQEEGDIRRETVQPPGVRARNYIQKIRQQDKPYAFDEVMGKAAEYSADGSLADAHLLFFFAAREGHIEAMMMMAEMSDPTLFRAENNLLDRADAVQAYKWYSQALEQGFEPAAQRLENLQQWAKAEAEFGNAAANQLLLNFN